MFKHEFKHIPSALVIALAFTCGRALGEPAIGECPQPRFTDRAPPEYLAKTDPWPEFAGPHPGPPQPPHAAPFR